MGIIVYINFGEKLSYGFNCPSHGFNFLNVYICSHENAAKTTSRTRRFTRSLVAAVSVLKSVLEN